MARLLKSRKAAFRARAAAVCSLLCVACLAGCGPTYPKERLAGSIVDLCKKEYNQGVSVSLKGKTLFVFTTLGAGLFDDNLAVKPQAMDKIGDILLASARVVLSSDANIDFCVVVAKDESLPGFEWMLTRYVNDIKRLFLGDISRGDFFERADFDVRFDPDASPANFAASLALEEVKLGDFLARQIARRAKSALSEDKSLNGIFEVKSVDGTYHGRFFTFSVDGSFLSKSESKADYVLARTLKIAEWVTSSYKFEDFDTASAFLSDGEAGRSIVADRKELKRYRKWEAK